MVEEEEVLWGGLDVGRSGILRVCFGFGEEGGGEDGFSWVVCICCLDWILEDWMDGWTDGRMDG